MDYFFDGIPPDKNGDSARYEILQNLVNKGICNEITRNGQKFYSAAEPKMVLQKIISIYDYEIKNEKKDSEEQKNKITLLFQEKALAEQNRLTEITQKKISTLEKKKNLAISIEDELAALYLKNQQYSKPLDYIEILTDKEQIKEKAMAIQKNTKRELLAFTKPPYTMSFDENIVAEEETMQSKLIIKSIYESKNITSPEEVRNFIKMIDAFQRIGEETRIVEELPMKLAISDDTITLLALNDRLSLSPTITTMIIDHPSFAKALKAVFESYWNSAMTLEEYMGSIHL